MEKCVSQAQNCDDDLSQSAWLPMPDQRDDEKFQNKNKECECGEYKINDFSLQ